MDNKSTLSAILSHFPDSVRSPLLRSRNIYEQSVHEITLRAGRPVCVYCADKRYYPASSGILSERPDDPDIISTSSEDLRDVFMSLCDYSVYAHQDELTRGYITISCGARVGICGEAVMRDGEAVNIKNISTLSFRVPRQVVGYSTEVLKLIDPIKGALICGAPCSGKTTLIRDMARELSYSYRVSVIDERGELYGRAGVGSSYDPGLCDVTVNMPKGMAILNSVRSLAPDIIVCDELGDDRDVEAVRYALRCGAAFIATVHAACIEDLRSRAVIRELLSAGAFRYLVFLSGRRYSGKVSRIYEWSADCV